MRARRGDRMTASEPVWDDAPVYLSVIAADGTVVFCNATQASLVGRVGDAMPGQAAATLYAPQSLHTLRQVLSEMPFSGLRRLNLQLKRQGGAAFSVTALGDCVELPGRDVCLRLSVPATGDEEPRLQQLERDHEMLDSIVSTAKDACWCIEFAEPVDLTAPEDETLRQVFENVCFWRVMNPAMMELYKLPLGRDVRKENVRFVFPRNPENEAFVRMLIRSRFHLDNAPSRDQRYDGAYITAENDVRGFIRDNYLIRMWGTVRDVSARREREQELAEQLADVRSILSALPDPVLVIGTDGRIDAANPALAWRLGWSLDDILGRPLTDLVENDELLPTLAALEPGATDWQETVRIRAVEGDFVSCELRASLCDRGGGRRSFVLSLRPRSEMRSAGGSLEMRSRDVAVWREAAPVGVHGNRPPRVARDRKAGN